MSLWAGASINESDLTWNRLSQSSDDKRRSRQADRELHCRGRLVIEGKSQDKYRRQTKDCSTSESVRIEKVNNGWWVGPSFKSVGWGQCRERNLDLALRRSNASINLHADQGRTVPRRTACDHPHSPQTVYRTRPGPQEDLAYQTNDRCTPWRLCRCSCTAGMQSTGSEELDCILSRRRRPSVAFSAGARSDMVPRPIEAQSQVGHCFSIE